MDTLLIVLTRGVAAPLALERQGDTLIFNGQPLDLSTVPADATVEHGAIVDSEVESRVDRVLPWINGPITRSGGVLTVPVIAPYAGGHLPPELWHPAPIQDPPDGPVVLPAHEVSDAQD